jgi:GAF domain-containing protein
MDDTLRLLIVDDEQSLREPLRDFFNSQYKFHVDTAANGKEALRRVEEAQGNYDVALIDQNLVPGPDGITVMRSLKARAPKIECIILTGWGAEQKLQALIDGAFRYIEKPFNKAELVMLIRSAALQVRLRATSRAILSQADHELILEQLVAAAKALTLADAVALVLADGAPAARALYTVGMPSTDKVRAHTFVDFVLGGDAQEHSSMLPIAPLADDDPRTAWLQAEGFTAMLAAPVHSEKSHLGVLYAFSRDTGKADSWGASAMLQTLADQTSLAISHAQAFQQLQAQATYMSALVAVGQELTRTIHVDEQLELAWQFVRQQLQVATFSLALYDKERNTISFPLVVDEEVRKHLADDYLGTDPETWGVTGYVVKHNVEVAWSTLAQKQAACDQLGIKLKIDGKTSHSLFCIPLRLGMDVVGALSVQSYSEWAFSSTQLDACRALANLLVAALENSRLVAEAKRQAQDLELLQRYLTTISSSLDLAQVMTQTCHTAVDFFRAEHSGLVMFDGDRKSGTVAAEYPAEVGASGLAIPLQGVPDEEDLAAEGKVLVVEDVEHATALGPVRDILFDRLQIQSILIVPVRDERGVLGSFSLDSIDRKRRFTDFEVSLCRLFADQVAGAIKNARVHAETVRREKLLSALEEASQHIRAETDPHKLMHQIVRLASELMQCSGGALYINETPVRQLQVSAVDRVPDDVLPKRINHKQGLVGLAAATGEVQLVSYEHGDANGDRWLAKGGFRMAVAVPLKKGAEVAGVLLLVDSERQQGCSDADKEILRRFARQAVIALQTSQAMTNEQRSLLQYEILNQISSRIVAAGEIDKILHISLTGVTAGYGLGYNRAALLLMDRTGGRLVGQLAIGNLNEVDARRDWEEDQRNEQYAFSSYLDKLETNTLESTPLDHRIRKLSLPLDHSSGLFGTIVRQQKTRIVDRLDNLPAAFLDAFEPSVPFVIVSLVARDHTIGVLVADNKFTRSPITNGSLPALVNFANTAAIAVANARLYAEARRGQEHLRAYYETSTTLVTSKDTKQMLQDMVEHACRTAQAQRVALVFFTQDMRPSPFFLNGSSRVANISDIVRLSSGLSLQVLRTGTPVAVEDTEATTLDINTSPFWHEFRAALCLPVTLSGERTGVMWFFYTHPRTFAPEEIDAIQLYVNHAAIAHEAAQRIEELGQMRQAAEAMSKARTPRAALQQIVESAAKVLEADSAALWSYDDVRDRFIPEELTVLNISADETEHIRRSEPSPGHTTKRVMEQGYVAVTDLSEPNADFLGLPTRTFLARLGVKSFQAVRLQVGDETLGVLYVNHLEQKTYGADQRVALETFASHAAQTLKTARLLAQLERTQRAASVIAGAVVQRDLRSTLDAIAQHTREVLDAEAVTLYAYDERTDTFTHWGKNIVEPRKVDSGTLPANLTRDAAPYRLLEILYAPFFRVAEENASGDFLLGGEFTTDEGIRAAAGFQLRADQHKVGVMFVNFRSPHRFTNDEITTMQLFADQAAMAVRNSILYEEVSDTANRNDRLFRQSELVATLTREAAANLALDAFLENLFGGLDRVYQARGIGIYPSLAVYDAASETLETYATRWYPTNVRPSRLPITSPGIMCWVARHCASYISSDVRSDPVYNQLLDITRAEIAVPVLLDGKLFGVLDLESPVSSAFSKEDQQFLETLAAQIAATARNVRQYEELVRTRSQMAARTAVAWIGMVSAQWRHQLESDVTTIRDSVPLLRSAIAAHADDKIDQRLTTIERIAKRILASQITAPLDADKGVESVAIAKLFRSQYDSYRLRDRYRDTQIKLTCDLMDSVTVRVNPDWLARALDLVVDNAADAMLNSPTKEIHICLAVIDRCVKVCVTDTGPGIPAPVRQYLFQKPIEKQQGEKGMGVGLLLAQTILQTYQGEIHVESTGPDGTVMIFLLPRE